MKSIVLYVLGISLAIIILVPVIFIGYLTLNNPSHEGKEALMSTSNPEAQAPADKIYRATTFNIGYGGLDRNQDFFFDGGKNSRGESKAVVQKNLEAMTSFLLEQNSDFLMIQEIDRKASRSYDIEQYEYLQNELRGYGSSFAYNYNALWVPLPVFNPMGYANAGLGTFSRYRVSEALRHQLEGQESWPMILAELDRCLLETRIPLDNGESLVLINLHLSAYDKGGELRKQQVEHVIRYMEELYKEGNYVVLGGDWNQLLGTKQLEDPEFKDHWPEWLVQAPDSLTDSGFIWGIDEEVMTVRDLATAYVPGETFETIIDGFLVSPNVEILEVQGHDLGYENTDHNPVSMEFRLKSKEEN
ncbi:endonuclease/exonuclease/phosphatase family protein [Isachenkonia alkalipeptolytica]|uniref:Endonuclease/exonuclease/phosphatase family protein n=1 Tax=Isachenkonia alkalipeptolytica TaxID=2565777 RepID=A0AA44BED7_9CLOT|nr:endonuclease/exonuclease/phosphatase family protein [Isachenkonia alkalipeptolytica]NBG88843.1 endonuclease/exonuclease/phosphatase family protein [Isachenkonia alkalipeptolytica]